MRGTLVKRIRREAWVQASRVTTGPNIPVVARRFYKKAKKQMRNGGG